MDSRVVRTVDQIVDEYDGQIKIMGPVAGKDIAFMPIRIEDYKKLRDAIPARCNICGRPS